MGEASAAAAVRVLAVVSRIAQAPGPAGSSTGDARVKLSFDAPCVMLPPSQTVLLYDLLAGSDSADDEFPAAA